MLTTKFKSNNWVFDPHSKLLKTNKNNTQLRPHVAQVLSLLCRNQGQTIHHDTFIEQIWENHYVVGLKGLRNSVWELRQHIDDVQTVPRKGYQLTTEVIETSTQQIIKDHKWLVFGLFSSLAFLFYLLLAMFVFTEEQFTFGNSELITPELGIEQNQNVSNDQQLMAFVKSLENGNFGVFIKKLDDLTQSEILITDPQHNVGAPSWNPEQTQLAYLKEVDDNYNCEVVIYDLKEKTHTVIGNATYVPIAFAPFGLDWSPDGRYLVFSTKEKEGWKAAVSYLDIKNQTVKKLTSPDFMDMNPTWSQNGEKILFTRLISPDESDLYEVDLNGQTNMVANIKAPILGYDHLNNDQFILSAYKDGAWSAFTYDKNNQQLKASHFGDGFQMPQVIENNIYYVKSHPKTRLFQTDIHSQNKISNLKELELSYVSSLNPPIIHDEYIYFISQQSGYQELWQYQTETEVLQQLTKVQSRISLPSISPSGQFFAFTQNDLKKNTTRIKILEKQSKKLTDMSALEGNFTFANWVDDETIAAIRFNDDKKELWLHKPSDIQYRKLIVSSGIQNLTSIPGKKILLVQISNKHYLLNIDEPHKMLELTFLTNELYAVTKTGIYYFDKNQNLMLRKFVNLESDIIISNEKFDSKTEIEGFSVDEKNQKIFWLIDKGTEKGIYKKTIL